MKRYLLILALVGSLLVQPLQAAQQQQTPRAAKTAATATAPAPIPQAQLVNRVLANGL